MVLGEILKGTGASLDASAASLEIKGITHDSRRVRPAYAFFALSGRRVDGHSFAADAMKHGAAVCICERRIEGLPLTQVVLPNARRALAFAAANFYGNPERRMKLIGVTGTNGKTSTAYMLKTIFSHSGYKTALLGTAKGSIGDAAYTPPLDGAEADEYETMTTPDPEVLYRTLADLADRGVEVTVMEASSHALALDKLAPIKFAVGIFTNLSREHLDFHGTMENYLAAKAKLFDRCRVGLFNADDAAGRTLLQNARCRAVSYGLTPPCDYLAEEIESRGVRGSTYILHTKNARFRIKTQIPGTFTLYNTLAAAAAARECGVNLVCIQNALYALRGIAGRLEKVNLGFAGGAFTAFIDYAHTPFALENLLRCVRAFRGTGQRIVTLFGCGGDRDRSKRPEMGRIATANSDYVIITSDNPRGEDPQTIIRDILGGVGAADNYKVIENRREAIEYAVANALAGDIILLVGKGHEQYEIDKDGLHPFSETEIVQEAAERYRS